MEMLPLRGVLTRPGIKSQFPMTPATMASVPGTPVAHRGPQIRQIMQFWSPKITSSVAGSTVTPSGAFVIADVASVPGGE